MAYLALPIKTVLQHHHRGVMRYVHAQVNSTPWNPTRSVRNTMTLAPRRTPRGDWGGAGPERYQSKGPFESPAVVEQLKVA